MIPKNEALAKSFAKNLVIWFKKVNKGQSRKKAVKKVNNGQKSKKSQKKSNFGIYQTYTNTRQNEALNCSEKLV